MLHYSEGSGSPDLDHDRVFLPPKQFTCPGWCIVNILPGDVAKKRAILLWINQIKKEHLHYCNCSFLI